MNPSPVATTADIHAVRSPDPEADARHAVAEVLTALAGAAQRRDDPLLAMATDALRAVHDLYDGYSAHAVATTPPVHARRAINRCLIDSLAGAARTVRLAQPTTQSA